LPAFPIAIIGMACRLPGAADLDAFWRLLREGVDAVGDVPSDRWDQQAYFSADPDAPGKLKSPAGGFIADIDKFDAEFFGISPREARKMDPQQRLLLEVTGRRSRTRGSRLRASPEAGPAFMSAYPQATTARCNSRSARRSTPIA